MADDGLVADIQDMRQTSVRINGGYFVFRQEIFDYIREGEDLVSEPFERLIRERKLGAMEYDGFWRSMDTFKDRQELEKILSCGNAPWEVWNHASVSTPEVRDTQR